MDAILALMNAVFLAFIVSTMFHVGLITTLEHLVGVVRDVRWLAGAIVASLVLVPLSGSAAMQDRYFSSPPPRSPTWKG